MQRGCHLAYHAGSSRAGVERVYKSEPAGWGRWGYWEMGDVMGDVPAPLISNFSTTRGG